MTDADETLPLDRGPAPDPAETADGSGGRAPDPAETADVSGERGPDPAETADVSTGVCEAETRDLHAELGGRADTEPRVDGPAAEGGGKIGPYRIERQLGKGGMGAVYLARSEKLDRQVALKVLHPDVASSREHLERFELEARAAARLRHEGIVAVYDVGEHRGTPYIVMEYVPGESLRSRLESQGALEPHEAATLIEQVARALAYAHSASILHRDLKPANILVDEDGRARIADFGLARDLAQTTARATQTGDVLGTPLYMPPEQARGDMASMDRRADVYSLGATLYELLTGKPTFDARTVAELLHQVLHDEPLAPSRQRGGIGADLDTICLKCLEKEPDQRYGSAQELADDLRRYLQHEPIRARPPGPGDRLGKWVRRNRLAAQVLTASVVLGLAAAGVGAGLFVSQVTVERDKAEAAAEDARVAKLAADDARALAEAEAERAEYRAQIAQSALRVLIQEVRNELVAVPGDRAIRARQKLLRHALEGLDRLAASTGKDAPIGDVFNAYQEIGGLAYDTGQVQRAAEAFQKAEAVSRAALAKADDPVNRLRLSTALMRLGDTHHAMGRLAETRTVWEECLAIRRALVAASPDETAYQVRLGNVLERESTLLKAEGDLPGAVKVCHEILGMQAYKDQPNLPGIMTFLSDAARQEGRLDEALARCKQAVALTRKLLTEGKWVDVELHVGRALYVQAQIELDMLRFEDAKASTEEMIRLSSEALAKTPSAGLHKAQLGTALLLLSEVHLRAEQPDEALAAAERALPLVNDRRRIDPDDASSINQEVLLRTARGKAYLMQDSLDAAAKELEAALALCAKLREKQPDDHMARINEPVALARLADVEVKQGKFDQALGRYALTLSRLEAAIAEHPTHDLVNMELPLMAQHQATLLLHLKRFADAEASLQRAISLQRTWLAEHAKDDRSERNLAVTLALLANAYEGQKRYADAHATLDECERLRRALMTRPNAQRRRVVRDLFALMERRVLVYRAERDLDGEIEASKRTLVVVKELATLDPRFEMAIKQYADWIKRLQRFKAKQERKAEGD